MDIVEIKSVLVKAREVIQDETCWTQHAYARDENGTIADPCNQDESCQWCMTGAVRSVLGHKRRADEDIVMKHLATSISEYIESVEDEKRRYRYTPRPHDFHSGFVAGFNDKPARKHRDVLAAFDKAIEMAQEGA